MLEITLERSEFLVLMDAVQANAVVGMDTNDLLPPSREIHQTMVQQGVAILKQRGLLTVNEEEVHLLDPGLALMAGVVARPSVAIITLRHTPNMGGQLFLHYQADAAVVEQTLPEEGRHRLALLEDGTLLFDRMVHILSVSETNEDKVSFTLPQQDFLEIKELTEQQQRESATQKLQSNEWSEPAITRLLDAIEQPVFSATVTMLRCQNEKVVDARDSVVLQGQNTAWLVAQTVPGRATFQLESIDKAALKDQFIRWFNELSTSPNGS